MRSARRRWRGRLKRGLVEGATGAASGTVGARIRHICFTVRSGYSPRQNTSRRGQTCFSSRPPMPRPPGAAANGAEILMQMAPPASFCLIMYLLILRPQQQRAKGAARKWCRRSGAGDTVITTGGLVGSRQQGGPTISRSRSRSRRTCACASCAGGISEVRSKGEPVKAEPAKAEPGKSNQGKKFGKNSAGQKLNPPKANPPKSNPRAANPLRASRAKARRTPPRLPKTRPESSHRSCCGSPSGKPSSPSPRR